MKHTCLFVTSLFALVPGQAAADDVTPIDAWGKYVTTFDLESSSTGKAAFRYVPQGHLHFLVKGAESDDVITARFFDGKKPLGPEVTCPVALEKIDAETQLASAYNCKPDLAKVGLSRPATITVKVGYKQAARGKAHEDLATYTFATKAHAGPNQAKEFHIDYDFRIGEAWAHVRSDGGFNLFAWFKEGNDEATQAARGKLRCTVGEKAWPFDELTNSRWAYEYDAYKGNTATKTRWTFQYFFPKGDARAWLAANPGDYRCVYTRNGDAERELVFTVKDGAVVKPACQTGATPLVRAPAATAYIKQVVKRAHDLPFDAKAHANAALLGRAGVAKACGF